MGCRPYIKEGEDFDFLKSRDTLNLREMADQLTEKQRGVFALACEKGYYKQPKGVTLGELAQLVDMSEATFREHLRKAESKLIPNINEIIKRF